MVHTVSKSFGWACVGWQKILTLELVLFVGLAVGMTTCRQEGIGNSNNFYSLLVDSVSCLPITCGPKEKRVVDINTSHVQSHSFPCINNNRVVVMVRYRAFLEVDQVCCKDVKSFAGL